MAEKTDDQIEAEKAEKNRERLEKEYIKAGSITITLAGNAVPLDDKGKPDKRHTEYVIATGGPDGMNAAFNNAKLVLSEALERKNSSDSRAAALAAKGVTEAQDKSAAKEAAKQEKADAKEAKAEAKDSKAEATK